MMGGSDDVVDGMKLDGVAWRGDGTKLGGVAWHGDGTKLGSVAWWDQRGEIDDGKISVARGR